MRAQCDPVTEDQATLSGTQPLTLRERSWLCRPCVTTGAWGQVHLLAGNNLLAFLRMVTEYDSSCAGRYYLPVLYLC